MNVGQYRSQPLPVINSKVSAPGVQQLAHGHLPKTCDLYPLIPATLRAALRVLKFVWLGSHSPACFRQD